MDDYTEDFGFEPPPFRPQPVAPETIRDRDARAAMQTLLAHYAPVNLSEDEEIRTLVAHAAYMMADAMQAERERREEEP